MPKARLSVAELFFIFLAASALFLFTIHQMSSDGILPGNDPAVHLDKAKTIVIRTTYSELPWYPPLFHTFLATLLLFVGTIDIIVASLMLKFVVATISVLILLSTYLLCRRLLGIRIAAASTVFAFLSVPLFKMIFWGGYANYLSIAYIVLIFYTINMKCTSSVKTFLLLLVPFTLVLTHQLSAFVFFIEFAPAFLISTINARAHSKRTFLAFLALILGGGLAILAWYAEVILRYSSVFISHIFFEIEEYILDIPYVSLDSLVEVFGYTLFLGLAGIALTFVFLKRRKALSVYPLLVLWIAVPFLLSQSFLFELYLPYERFIYYLATPITVFAGAAAYSLATLPTLIASKLSSKVKRKRKILNITQVFTFAILVSLFFSQGFLLLQRLQSFPQFYETSGMAGYNVGEWLRQYSISDGQVVVSKKPGAWLHLISDHKTIEETWSPVLGRNAVAESVLYLFYEMENTRTLTREYVSDGSLSGQALCLSIYNIWEKVLSIFDSNVYVTYMDTSGKEAVVSLSDTAKKTYWMQKSLDNTQLASEYSHNLFTLEKLVSVQSESPIVNLNWKFTARQNLSGIAMRIFSFTETFFDFREAFIPGVLDWQNPWDKPSSINMSGNWAMVDCPPNSLSDNLAALLDAENGVLVVFEFIDFPDWLNVGALGNRFIDTLRVGYEFGNLTKGESREISFSILLYPFEPRDIEQWTQDGLKQLLDSKTNLPVQGRDFLTYIEEYDIEFVVIDSQQLLLNVESSPILDRVYANDKFVIYAIRRTNVSVPNHVEVMFSPLSLP